jgi:hypothetical protein
VNYYASKKLKLLKDFDKTSDLMQGYILQHYGGEFADILYRETRQVYEELIPEIPHIEGPRARALNLFLLITAQELAVYRTMKKHGKTLSQTWEICHEAIRRRMEKFSKVKRWLLKKLMYSNFLMRRVKRRAERNEKLKFGDFEIKYLTGDGDKFDWGVDYLSCGNYNFLKAQGAEEFAPYVCMSDIPLGNALDWGLIRTQTIADGCQTCDFRFKKASETKISSRTPEVQATIEKILDSRS